MASAAALAVAAAVLSAAGAPAATCPNQGLRETQPHAAALPDCRAYEQVSPVDKGGVDARGFPSFVGASPSGAAIRYYSITPFPETPSVKASSSLYISSRLHPAQWFTRSILPEVLAARVLSSTEDLSESILWTEGSTPEGAPLALFERNYYLRDNETGAYRFLLSLPDGGEGLPESAYLYPAGFSADGAYLIFESGLRLLPEATAGKLNLYRWERETGQLSLVGLTPPGGEPSCGPSGPACEPSPTGSIAGAGAGAGIPGPHAIPSHYNQATISADGATVYFTANGGPSEGDAGQNGRLYARLNGVETIAISQGIAHFCAASPNGRYVFYTEAGDLYRFDAQTRERLALTTGDAGVRGLLGVSADGSTAYFPAAAVLAHNQNPEGEEAEDVEVGTVHGRRFIVTNVYEWRDEGALATTTFVTKLSMQSPGDREDWADVYNDGSGQKVKTARLTPDGQTLLFSSVLPLTGYDNTAVGSCDGSALHGEACDEFYRYRAASQAAPASLNCVSCDPSGARPLTSVALAGEGAGSVAVQPQPYLTRNLSTDGDRVFFQTADPLLPADTDTGANPFCAGEASSIGPPTGCDVYEWEAPGGGSCTESSPAFFASDGGCLGLISTGTSSEESYFGDASANGEDVFFFTRQRLASTDEDNNYDVYDARVDAGACGEAGNPCPSPPKQEVPCSGEGCRPTASAPPSTPLLASASFFGPGNLVPPAPLVKPKARTTTPRCFGGKRLSHGKCVKTKRKQRVNARRTSDDRKARR